MIPECDLYRLVSYLRFTVKLGMIGSEAQGIDFQSTKENQSVSMFADDMAKIIDLGVVHTRSHHMAPHIHVCFANEAFDNSFEGA